MFHILKIKIKIKDALLSLHSLIEILCSTINKNKFHNKKHVILISKQ